MNHVEDKYVAQAVFGGQLNTHHTGCDAAACNAERLLHDARVQ